MKLAKRRGQSILEIMVAAAVFVISITVIIYLYVDAGSASRFGLERSQAVNLAREGLAAARMMRDTNYASLTTGAHGLSATSTWSFSGVSDLTDIFTRTITVTDISTTSKQITSKVAWTITPPGRIEDVTLNTRLTLRPTGSVAPPALWGQALYFTQNNTGAVRGGSSITGWTIVNASSTSITIAQMRVSWTPVGGSINRIRIGGTQIWNTTTASGVLINVTDRIISNNSSQSLDIRWVASPTGDTIKVEYIFTDGSIATSTPFLVP